MILFRTTLSLILNIFSLKPCEIKILVIIITNIIKNEILLLIGSRKTFIN